MSRAPHGRLLVYAPPSAEADLHRAALLVDGRLEDLLLQPTHRAGPQAGERHAAMVDRTTRDGVFLKLQEGETAFLPGDAPPPGSMLLIEILRPAEGAKAARASRRVEFAGEGVVATLGAPGVNVSRKLSGAQRTRLKAAAAAALAETRDAPSDLGAVVRSSAAELPDDRFAKACRSVFASAAAAAAAAGLGGPPKRLSAAPIGFAAARNRWPNIERVAVPSGFQVDASAIAIDQMADPFDAFDLDARLDALAAPRVALASNGGWMALSRLEALVAVDVNAGGGSRVEANRAAAQALPRELRLRNWGGMVLVDFAGRSDEERRRLETTLRRAADPALEIAGWGPLGLLEATRRRDGPPIETLWPPRAV